MPHVDFIFVNVTCSCRLFFPMWHIIFMKVQCHMLLYFYPFSRATRPHVTVSSLKKRGCVELSILGLNTNKMYMGQNKIIPWDIVIS